MLHLRRAATALAARGAGQASKAAAPAGPSAAAGLKARFGTTPQRRLAEKAAKEGVEAEAGEAAEAAGGWLKGFAKSKVGGGAGGGLGEGWLAGGMDVWPAARCELFLRALSCAPATCLHSRTLGV